MTNWIELQKRIADFEGFEDLDLWKARAHYDGHIHDGYALCTSDVCDWYDGMPGRDIADQDLCNGLRLPAYTPGHKPEEE